MIGYPYITELFKTILSQSSAIAGRFYICPQAGAELNNPSLEEVFTNTFTGDKPKIYPLSILLPPVSTSDYGKVNHKDDFSFVMYFLKGSGSDSHGQIANRNPVNNQSLHTIPEDWHDMKRVATNFLQVLRMVTINGAGSNGFFISDRDKPVIYPVTLIGNDRVSGVCLQFKGFANSLCTIEDYANTFIDDITLPAYTDSHPSHKM